MVTGGDGNQWVRRSFDRFEIKQEFVLDRFHLTRAARRAIQDKESAIEIVKELRQSGFSGVDRKLKEMIGRASGKKEGKLKQFYQYIYHQQDGLLDLERRGYPASASLGAIEGNVDKLVVHRMKGRGCCWKLTGASVMLPICQYKDKIRDLAFRYQSLGLPEKPSRRLETYTDVGVYLQTRMPFFYDPDQDKPWVTSLYRYVHYR